MPKAARITPDGLTLKEEMFCQEYFSNGGDGLGAYLKVYSPGSHRSDRWLREETYKLLHRDHMLKRIEKLRSKVESLAAYTADHAMKEAGEAFELAKKLKLPAAMTGAVTLRAKLAGHLVEKREVSTKSLKEYSRDELDSALQEAAREAGIVIQKVRDESKGSK